MSLTPLVCQVHRLRQEALEAINKRAASYDAWRVANEGLLTAEATAKAVLATAEEALRDSAVASYHIDGNKSPGPGLGIRVGARLEYDGAVALAWAKEHSMALTLDVKGFESIAKAEKLPFVAFTPVVTATLAADLGKALEAVKKEAK